MAMIVGSKGGSTAEFLIQQMQLGNLDMTPAVVIAPTALAKPLKIAKRLNVPGEFIYENNFETEEEFGFVFDNILDRHEATVVSLNGALMRIHKSTIKKYANRIFNQHGGPLPETKNLSGPRIAATVLDIAKEIPRIDKMPIVVQRVAERIDGGEIVEVRWVPILPGDNPQTLQERGKIYEREAQLSHWQKFLSGEVCEIIVPDFTQEYEKDIVKAARKKAIRQYPRE